MNPPQGMNMQFQAQPSTPNQGLSPPLQAQDMQPITPPQEMNLQETQQIPSPQGVNIPLDANTLVNPAPVEAGPREQQGYAYPTNYGYSNGVQHAPNAYGHYNN